MSRITKILSAVMVIAIVVSAVVGIGSLVTHDPKPLVTTGKSTTATNNTKNPNAGTPKPNTDTSSAGAVGKTPSGQTPNTLADTGPGDSRLLFVAVAAASYVAYYYKLRKRAVIN